MNKQDRKRVEEISAELAKLAAQIEPLAGELSDMAEAEQEKFDNMSDGLQQGEGGQAIQEAAETLATIAEKVQAAFDGLDEAENEFGSLV